MFKSPYGYHLVMAGCLQFLLLTTVAMGTYPGGTLADPAAPGYQFLTNFFSDLGLNQSYLGMPNTVSQVLFVVALALAGLSLITFFGLFPALFRHRPVPFGLSLVGSTLGVGTGLAFIGVAFTPADQFPAAHTNFVFLAFISFLLAVALYTPAILLLPEYPNQYTVIFLVFALLLAAYVWLLFYGPALETPTGLRIQATGQKVIAYAAIAALFWQADGARRQWRARQQTEPQP